MKQLITIFRSFGQLTDEEARLAGSYFELRHYREGGQLFSGGHICKELFFISSGVARIISVNDKGLDETYFFIPEKQFCTLLQSFNEAIVTDESIQACCDTTALVITKIKLLELYDAVPVMKVIIGKINEQRLLEKIRLKNIYAGKDSLERYKLFIQEQPGIILHVPLKDVASYLGITPQSLSRIRRNFK